MKTKGIGKKIIFIFLCSFTLIQLYPLVWLILFSFKDNNEIFSQNIIGLPRVWRVSNYVEALTNGNVAVYFLNSLLVTTVTILVSSILLSACGYAIVRMKWKLSKLTLSYLLLGMMVPIHATLLPMFIVLRDIKLIDTYFALIIPYIAFALPMGIFILTSFLANIPKEMEEAACIDGCSIYGIFFRIVLPLIKSAIATIAIFTYLSSWNELMFASTFLNSDNLKTLPVGIMSLSGQYTTKWGPIGAGLVIATAPTIMIYILLSDQVQKSLVMGAVKG